MPWQVLAHFENNNIKSYDLRWRFHRKRPVFNARGHVAQFLEL